MDLENNIQVCQLFDLYGCLLTDNQQSIIKAYYYQNLSLGEIAKNNNITRQAIFDAIKKSVLMLKSYESKLNLCKKFTAIKKHFKNTNQTELEDEVLNILYQ